MELDNDGKEIELAEGVLLCGFVVCVDLLKLNCVIISKGKYFEKIKVSKAKWSTHELLMKIKDIGGTFRRNFTTCAYLIKLRAQRYFIKRVHIIKDVSERDY